MNQIRTREEGEAVIRGSGTGGKLALLGIAAFIAGITAVCVGAGAGQIHSAVDVILVILRFAGMVLAFLLQVFTVAVSAVILLLMLLFPGGSPRVEERVMTNVQETIEEVTGVARFQVPEWFWPAVLTAAGLVCLAFVLMKFKGVRFRRPERKKTVHRVTRKNHAFSALKQMAKALISRLSSELRYRKNKNTLAGFWSSPSGPEKGESWGVWRRRVRGNIFAGWRPRGRKKRGRKRMTRSCLWRTASTRCTTREGTALRGRSAGSTGGSWKNILRFKAFEFLYRQKVEKECDEWYNEL